MKTAKEYSVVIYALFVFTVGQTYADGDEGFIYGKITMKNDDTYQGVIRWGKEEAFWDDMFNSSKEEYALEDRLTNKELDYLEDEIWDKRRRRNRGWFWNRMDGWLTTHQFKCRFGDLKQLEMLPGKHLRLTLKNGDQVEVSGGSNDVGATLRIMDEELGKVELKWRRIARVEFMQTPREVQDKFGSPLYGTVETRRGSFEGFIQWDHEECLSGDILNGKHDDGKMAIEFGRIKSIEKHRSGSLVILKSGREFYLRGSNDVDDDNRGIVIKELNLGKVLVEWREFKKVTFAEDVKDSGPAYNDFSEPKRLTGLVKTDDDETLSGRMIYDLDEALDLEILDGENRGIKYRIPFRNIKAIVPEGRFGATVELKNGRKLELDDSRDVDRGNDGLLVWVEDKTMRYVSWNDIRRLDLH